MQLNFKRAKAVQSPEEMIKRAIDAGHDPDVARRTIEDMTRNEEIWLDQHAGLQVAVRRNVPNGFGSAVIHLSIKRLDREPIDDWRVKQAIKNALVGSECEAIEIYPAEERKVDGSNQYHLWCFADASVRIPVGFTERLVTNEPLQGGKQRPYPMDDPWGPSYANVRDSEVLGKSIGVSGSRRIPAQPSVESMTVAVVSTAHLSPDTHDLLDSNRPSGWPRPGYAGEYGWIIWCGGDITEETVKGTPVDLLGAIAWARQGGWEWIRFDADAETVDGLEVYEHR